MITAEEAKNIVLESDRMKEMSEERFREVCERVSNHIKKQSESGYNFVDLKTSFMYPFRDKVISELLNNGYEVELYPSSGILPEYLLINWK